MANELKITTCEEYVLDELFKTKKELEELREDYMSMEVFSNGLDRAHKKLVNIVKVIVKNMEVVEDIGVKITGYFILSNEELAQALLDLYKMFENTPKREEK